jgi:hypothetical protein
MLASAISRIVGSGGGTAKSRRREVLLKSRLDVPTKGRAITRPMLKGSTSRRATAQISWSRSSPKTCSWAAIWNTLSADV